MNQGSLDKILQYVQSGYVLPEPACKYILHSVFSAVSFMHSKNVLHRDIKSLNILTNSLGEIKVADMGMSTFKDDWEEYRHTRVGTSYWQAPELLNGRNYTKNVDVYSLGCLAYEIATGKPPHLKRGDHK